VQSGSPTGWVPQSKPVWFTEFGFPSADKGTNQPNVFVDEKSSESAWPYYSARHCDDVIQRRGVEALHHLRRRVVDDERRQVVEAIPKNRVP
jgi:hypothetical protein